MSSSEAAPSNSATEDVQAAAALLDRVVGSGQSGHVNEPALRAAIGAVLRLYENACIDARREILPVGADVSTTSAVTLACALARSQSLTAFDFALWFSHTAPRAEAAHEHE